MSEESGDTARGNASRLNVFISYSRDDFDFADQLAVALGLHNFEVTMDRQGISGGEDWRTRLGGLIRDADTIVFVLSPASALSPMCRWEVEQAVRLGKRIIPVLCRPLESSTPPPELSGLDYIFFYDEPRSPGSGWGRGQARLVAALNTDLDWLREHTRLLQRASEWQAGGRPSNRLLSGGDVAAAKAWAARRPKGALEPTALHLDFIGASEDFEGARLSEERRRLEERERLVHEAERAVAERAAAQEQAVKTRDAAVLAQSKYLADLSLEETERQNPVTGLLLAIEALPDKDSDDQIARTKTFWPPAEMSLELARRAIRERQLIANTYSSYVIAITPDGGCIIDCLNDVVRIRETATLNEVRSLDHGSPVTCAVLTADGARIATGGRDGTVAWP